MNCNCITEIEEKVKDTHPEWNGKKVVSIKMDKIFTFNPTAIRTSSNLVVEVEGQKKKYDVGITHTFCPFCGENQSLEEAFVPSQLDSDFINWADNYFVIKEANSEEESSKNLNTPISKDTVYQDFVKVTKLTEWTAKRFKNALKTYCQDKGYIFNPRGFLNAPNRRIVLRIEGRTQEAFYIQTKENQHINQ